MVRENFGDHILVYVGNNPSLTQIWLKTLLHLRRTILKAHLSNRRTSDFVDAAKGKINWPRTGRVMANTSKPLVFIFRVLIHMYIKIHKFRYLSKISNIQYPWLIYFLHESDSLSRIHDDDSQLRWVRVTLHKIPFDSPSFKMSQSDYVILIMTHTELKWVRLTTCEMPKTRPFSKTSRNDSDKFAMTHLFLIWV